MMKEKPFSDKQTLVHFFSCLVESKDEEISKLQKNIDNLDFNNKEQTHLLNQLRDSAQNLGSQYEDLKVKQKNFSEAVIESEIGIRKQAY